MLVSLFGIFRILEGSHLFLSLTLIASCCSSDFSGFTLTCDVACTHGTWILDSRARILVHIT